MNLDRRHPLLSATIVTSLGTLASRVLGLVRDMVTAALFGLAAGGVMDALVVAFRIPNLFRGLFGEGALTASYLPVFAQSRERDPRGAWRLFVATSLWLAGVLTVVVFAGEVVMGIWAWIVRDDSRVLLLAGLSAAMLPYLVLVCLAAITSATLQAMGRFAVAAFAPAVLNVCWIVGVVAIAPGLAADSSAQAYILAVCVLIGGVLQWVVQWPALKRAGFQFGYDFVGTRDELRQIRRGMIPTAVSMAVVQFNTLMDSLVAWGLSAPQGTSATISWLGGVPYPMKSGAAAALYFGERLYQFPLGLLGIAAATVVFPLLSQHAARGDRAAVGSDLTLGVRMVLLAAIPCSVGLVLLAEPIARLLFERGQFTANDTARTARMIAVFGGGVWAYCALPVIVRGFYAVGDRVTPLRMSLAAVAFNLTLDFTLVWPLAEAGLAAATALAAAVQVAGLAILFSRGHVALDWRRLGTTVVRAMIAAAAMTAAGLVVLNTIPMEGGTWNALLRVVGPMAACVTIYVAVLALIGRSEWTGFGRAE